MRAIAALGKMQDPKVIEFLVGLLKGSDDAIKPIVVKSLGELHAAQALPGLLDLLQKESIHGQHSGIYHAISEAFQEISGIKDDLENAFPRKFPSLLHIDSAQTSLPEAIGSLGDEHIQMLNDMLAKMEDRMQEVSKMIDLPPNMVQDFSERTWQFGAMFADARDARQERVKLLLDLLICQSPLKRAAAALTLPWYADSQAIGPLEEAMHDEDAMVRRASKWALAALNASVNARGDDTPPCSIKGLFGG
jgi:HEAT repeat protein